MNPELLEEKAPVPEAASARHPGDRRPAGGAAAGRPHAGEAVPLRVRLQRRRGPREAGRERVRAGALRHPDAGRVRPRPDRRDRQAAPGHGDSPRHRRRRSRHRQASLPARRPWLPGEAVLARAAPDHDDERAAPARAGDGREGAQPGSAGERGETGRALPRRARPRPAAGDRGAALVPAGNGRAPGQGDRDARRRDRAPRQPDGLDRRLPRQPGWGSTPNGCCCCAPPRRCTTSARSPPRTGSSASRGR